MKTLRSLLVQALVLSCLICYPSRAAEPDGDKWDVLFNGKDLSGWVGVHDVQFEVVEGNLRLVRGMGWLRTEKQYGDFVLEFEWRALEEKYDSGIFLRAGLEGKPWPKDGWQGRALPIRRPGRVGERDSSDRAGRAHSGCRSTSGSSSASK